MTVIRMTHQIVSLSEEVLDCKVEFESHSDSIVKPLSIVNLCQEEILWMLLTMLRCCHICRTKWDAKQPEKWILQCDSVPSHMAMSVQQFLMEKQITLMPQPLYSPDLAHCDVWWLLRLKKWAFKSWCFGHLKLWMQHGSWPASRTKGGFLWVLASMAKVLEQLCVCVFVCREWLEWKSPRFGYWSFPAEFLELFHTPT